MKKILLGLSLLLMLATACRRETPEEPTPKSPLPPETQTGANTFGCYINGAPWTPVSNQWSMPRLSASYDVDKTLTVVATRTTKDEATDIVLFSEYLPNVGTYSLEKNTKQAVDFRDYKNNLLIFHHDADVEATGSLIITKLDLNAGIVSGRFEFTLKKQGHPEVKVTAGRFDCKM